MRVRKNTVLTIIVCVLGLLVVYAWYLVQHTALEPLAGCHPTTEGNC